MSEKLRIEDLKVGDKVEYCGWPSRTTWNTYEVVEVTRDRTGPCVILHNTCGPCCHQQTIDNGYLRRVPAPEPVPASAEGTKVLVKPSGSDWVYYVPKSLVDEVKKLAEGAEAKLTQRVAELEKALKSETHELARVKAERDTAMQATKKAQEELEIARLAERTAQAQRDGWSENCTKLHEREKELEAENKKLSDMMGGVCQRLYNHTSGLLDGAGAPTSNVIYERVEWLVLNRDFWMGQHRDVSARVEGLRKRADELNKELAYIANEVMSTRMPGETVAQTVARLSAKCNDFRDRALLAERHLGQFKKFVDAVCVAKAALARGES